MELKECFIKNGHRNRDEQPRASMEDTLNGTLNIIKAHVPEKRKKRALSIKTRLQSISAYLIE